MYLSTLLIDVGRNPDRPRPGRLWLRNRYHVHQRLCMAFPSGPRKTVDPEFLAPFRPDDFGAGQVHVPRSAEAGFLFRVDAIPGGNVVILVQSAGFADPPNWQYAFHNALYLLAAPPQVQKYEPSFKEGERYSFRLEANPSERIGLKSDPRYGTRVPIQNDRLTKWLRTRASAGGFAVDPDSVEVITRYIYMNKGRHADTGINAPKRGIQYRTARFTGVLNITDPVVIIKTITEGIGPAKAFGFGLLSLAPL